VYFLSFSVFHLRVTRFPGLKAGMYVVLADTFGNVFKKPMKMFPLSLFTF